MAHVSFSQVVTEHFEMLSLAGFEPGNYCIKDERRSTEQKATSVVPHQGFITYFSLKMLLSAMMSIHLPTNFFS